MTPLAPPTNLVLVGTPTATSITIAWTRDPSAAATAAGYSVERALGAGAFTALTPAVSGITTVTFTNTGLTKNTTYRYRVRAIKPYSAPTVFSSYTNILSATTAKK